MDRCAIRHQAITTASVSESRHSTPPDHTGIEAYLPQHDQLVRHALWRFQALTDCQVGHVLRKALVVGQHRPHLVKCIDEQQFIRTQALNKLAAVHSVCNVHSICNAFANDAYPSSIVFASLMGE